MKIVLMGPPGSGKGTLAQRLKEKLGLPHVSSGDVLRNEVSSGTGFGKKIQSYMEKGEIGPVELITEIMMNYLESRCPDGFILDGFPRTEYQAEKLAAAHEISSALLIDISEEAIVERITGRRTCSRCNAIYHIRNNPPGREGVCDTCGGALFQRSDDTEETVLNRIAVYIQQTLPVIEFYRDAGILHTINGAGSPADIFNEVCQLLKEKSPG